MKPLEIYLHIPFCIKKCNYCDFLSAPSTVAEREEYVKSLCEKIRSYGELAKAYRVISIFVGGGTPSILETEQMSEIFRALHDTFSIETDAEITIEMNPGTVTREKLKSYRACGVNRLSIGLQSVNDEELKFLGRIHTYEDFLETYQMAREEGFANINVDLISAIPGQTVDSWRRTLSTVADLHPEHISAYSLIIEEGTPFFDIYGKEQSDNGAQQENKARQDHKQCNHKDAWSVKKLPDEDSERQMYEDTERILAEYGYTRYEISNYAKAGYECIHNLGYWNRTEYLGIGVGAASFMNHMRWTEEETQEKLSVENEMEEYMFLGLRKMQGVSKKKFEEYFEVPMDEIYGDTLREMEEAGLLVQDADYVRLTKRGIDVSNYVMSEFLLT